MIKTCAYCKDFFFEGEGYREDWCCRTCYEDDLARYLEDKRDGERDERDIKK
jgi:hypothetical protein